MSDADRFLPRKEIMELTGLTATQIQWAVSKPFRPSIRRTERPPYLYSLKDSMKEMKRIQESKEFKGIADYISVMDASSQSGVRPEVIRYWALKGYISSRKFGRNVRVKLQEILEFKNGGGKRMPSKAELNSTSAHARLTLHDQKRYLGLVELQKVFDGHVRRKRHG